MMRVLWRGRALARSRCSSMLVGVTTTLVSGITGKLYVGSHFIVESSIASGGSGGTS